MTTRLRHILEHMRELERQMERELTVARDEWGYRFEAKRIRFEPDVALRHRQLKQSIPRFLRDGSWFNLATTPIIYSLAIPFALLDLWVTAYQYLCFPIYGIARVDRGRFIGIDRDRLAYLNGIEKLHCVLCGYVNGVVSYVRETAARTEQYWCPIKHARPVEAPHPRYRLFPDYGDAESYHRELPALRRSLRDDTRPGVPASHAPSASKN